MEAPSFKRAISDSILLIHLPAVTSRSHGVVSHYYVIVVSADIKRSPDEVKLDDMVRTHPFSHKTISLYSLGGVIFAFTFSFSSTT